LIVSTHVNFGPLAWALSCLLKVPYVLVAHGIDVGPSMTASRLRALRGAARVWSVSRWTRHRVLECGVSGDRISILPNAVSAEDFHPGEAAADLRSRYALSGEEKVILTVGRLDPAEAYKGHDRIIRALPDVIRAVGVVRYLIVGSGEDQRRVRRLAAQAGVEECVTFCGFVPDVDLPHHYRLASVFAMPSTGEGFGRVFLEAMACGVPVLGGSQDGATDALADGALGLLVDPLSVGAIADGLVKLLRRQGPGWWFDRYVLRERCLERYGRRPFADRVRALVQELLVKSGS
jgi:glycosyltransferase involved in cell wall biosynthesis